MNAATPFQPSRARLGALAAMAIAMALAPLATATHVEPTFIEGPDNHDCSEFAAEGALELKVDPAESGAYTSADGSFSVTVTMEPDGKTFDWTASAAIVGVVFVKAGSAGHHHYEYDPAASSDTGLTSPGEDGNEISHISFCYLPEEDVPTCEDAPEMPECQPTCEDVPEMPECEPTCEDTPEMPECGPTCEDVPEMPECPTVCPEASIVAVAEADGRITVDVTASGAFSLYRSAGDAEPTLLGEFEGNVEYVDLDTTPGTVYTYFVVHGEALCDMVEVTAIPNFPTAVGLFAAAGLGAVGYAFMRRKK